MNWLKVAAHIKACVAMLLIASTTDADQDLQLWYDAPAERWVEALPIGNGSLGAMVFADPAKDHLQFNLDTLWTGGPHSYVHPGAKDALPELRRLLFAGEQKAAEELASERFMSQPLRQCSYQPCGDLWLEFDGQSSATEYRRELDLDTAVATTRFRAGENRLQRHYFSSYPAQAIIVHWTSEAADGADGTIRLTSPHRRSESRTLAADLLELTGQVGDGSPATADRLADEMKFRVLVAVLATDGKCAATDQALQVTGATHATVALVGATNFADYKTLDDQRPSGCDATLRALRGKSFVELRTAHEADHQSLFRRLSLDLGEPTEEQRALPTDRRVHAAATTPDPSLAALFFQYGRYLLIASSRPGSQPANLQGIWNDQLDPPWGSKYTTNINAEMNYWPAEPANLAECADPLFKAIGELSATGRDVADVHYGAPGWVLHHNFDLWRGAAPINASDHGIWPTGGAWLCEHLWQRYQFTPDREFLHDTAYPLMRDAAKFFSAYLVEDPRDPDKHLISGPSNSPEQGGLVMGPSMDHQIIRSLLAHTIAAAEILDCDADLQTQLTDTRRRIAPNHIGRRGQLQEWLADVDDPNNKHRHVSHLWGVYPGAEITPDAPPLFAAARKSLEERGDGGTGWSRAWKINLWARLRDGDRAHSVMHELLKLTDSPLTDYANGGGVYPNLFDAHPPFQIDGNFGAVSGVCEMLVQSHRTQDDVPFIELLPALPKAWPAGSVQGLRARGGYELDLAWEAGRLTTAKLHAKPGGPVVLGIGPKTMELNLPAGKSVDLVDF